jgi:hypothetical protein
VPPAAQPFARLGVGLAVALAQQHRELREVVLVPAVAWMSGRRAKPAGGAPRRP